MGDLRVGVFVRCRRTYRALAMVQCLRKRHRAANDQGPAVAATNRRAYQVTVERGAISSFGLPAKLEIGDRANLRPRGGP